jgi:hypothetical protein
MFVSSDASGEVYVIVRDQAASGTATGTTTSTATGPAATATTTGSRASRAFIFPFAVLVYPLACALFAFI